MGVYLVYSKKNMAISPDTVMIRSCRKLTNIAALRSQICGAMRPGYEFIRVIGHQSGLTADEAVKSGLLDLSPEINTKDGPPGHTAGTVYASMSDKVSAARLGCTFKELFPEMIPPEQNISFDVPAGSHLDGEICLQKDRKLFLLETGFLSQFSAMKRQFSSLINANNMLGNRFLGDISLRAFSRYFYPAINAHSVPQGKLIQIPTAPVIEAMLQNEGSLQRLKDLGIRRLLTISALICPYSWQKTPPAEDRRLNSLPAWSNNVLSWHPEHFNYRTVDIYAPEKREYFSAYYVALNAAIMVEEFEYNDFLSRQTD